jgi:hypothetical protein
MRKFLTLKHWQLFVLLFGIPMIIEFIIVVIVISNRDARAAFIFIPMMTILYMAMFFGWFYALGTNLFKRLPVTVNMSLTRFKIFLFIPVVYLLFFVVFMFGMVSAISLGGQPSPVIFVFIFPLHFFAMFCIFYCLYFNAKALKTVELQKAVTFSDYAGEFFLLWFFPIGVWILQPRINKLFDTTSDDSSDRLFEGYQGQ